MTGSLHVIATPIGHLDDLSPRAIATLHQCQLIAAEDTRHSARLLARHGIKAPLVSLHEHSQARRSKQLLEALAQDTAVALISDAGTPLISDPGYELVKAARERGYSVIPIPGPNAIIAALSVSGLPTDRFCFRGFPPTKTKARKAWFARWAERPETHVLFEACHRIQASMADLADVLGSRRPAFIAREMTKRHEQYIYADLEQLLQQLRDQTIPAKGEFVVIVAGYGKTARIDDMAEYAPWLAALAAELSTSQAAKIAAAATGLDRRSCYDLIQGLKNNS